MHFASAIKVDFFVAGDDAFEAERLRSRQRVEMPNGDLLNLEHLRFWASRLGVQDLLECVIQGTATTSDSEG